jgi:hypothetical protein
VCLEQPSSAATSTASSRQSVEPLRYSAATVSDLMRPSVAAGVGQIGDATRLRSSVERKLKMIAAARSAVLALYGNPAEGSVILPDRVAVLLGCEPKVDVQRLAHVAAVAYFEEPETIGLGAGGRANDADYSAKVWARRELGYCLDLRCDQRTATLTRYTHRGDQRERRINKSWCSDHSSDHSRASAKERSATLAVARRFDRELAAVRAGDLRAVR